MHYKEYQLRIIGFIVILFAGLWGLCPFIYLFLGFGITIIIGIIVIAIAIYVIKPVFDYLNKIGNGEI